MTETIEEKIRMSRSISETSLKIYMSNLRQIKKKYDGTTQIDDLTFLTDYKKIGEILDLELKTTTKKNRLTSICVALGIDKDKYGDLIKRYNGDLLVLGKNHTKFLRQQIKTDVEEKNWIEYGELMNIVERANNDRQHLFVKTTLTGKEFRQLQEYVMVVLYTKFSVRNDFRDMKVMANNDYNIEPDNIKNGYNYLVISNGDMVFYFNHSQKISTQVDTPINDVLDKWLHINRSGWLFVKSSDRSTPLKSQDITTHLNSFFNLYADGKKISSSMLRHIIISHQMEGKPTIKDIRDTNILHSLYRKIK